MNPTKANTSTSLIKAAMNEIRSWSPSVPMLPALIGTPCYFLFFHPPGVSWLLGTLLAFFLFDNLGVQVGVHKLMAHRAFETSPWTRRILAFLAILSGQGSPLFWVAVHMGSHHPHSDHEKDIHSPRFGLMNAFLLWYWRTDFSTLNFSPARAYLRDSYLVFMHRNHVPIILIYWIALALLGPQYLVYLGWLPVCLSLAMVGFVNAFMHSHGRVSRFLFMKYQTYPDGQTYNSVWLGALTMGLGLHNNHHNQAARIVSAERWFEIDLSVLVVPLIRKTKD